MGGAPSAACHHAHLEASASVASGCSSPAQLLRALFLRGAVPMLLRLLPSRQARAPPPAARRPELPLLRWL